MDRYVTTDQSLWTGRIDSHSDSNQFRMHQIVKCIDFQQLNTLIPGFSLLGYACDEGVRRNKGTVGAKEGPAAFRNAFSNLAAHELEILHDLGTVVCEDGNLEATQERFSKIVDEAIQANQKLIAIGGGHDIAYGHFQGLRKALGKEAKIGIINFDAHFDLREVEEHPSSGTPFWQIADEEALNYCCIGIQASGNTKKLYEAARTHDVLIIERNEMGMLPFEEQFSEFIESMDYLYLTIDLDGFDMSYCPGVSAPTVNGFSYQEIRSYLMKAATSKKLVSMDIAELNPHYDQRQQTAKMSAYLAYEVIKYWS